MLNNIVIFMKIVLKFYKKNVSRQMNTNNLIY